MKESEAVKEFQQSIDLPFGCNVSKEASELAIQALEKQIPMKPRKTDSYRGVLKRIYAYVCPTCGNVCLEKYMNERQNTIFCWNCGQRLDWSDEHEID